jgi:hypothetical protein
LARDFGLSLLISRCRFDEPGSARLLSYCHAGKITEIAVLTDPVRLRQFGLAVLNG